MTLGGGQVQISKGRKDCLLLILPISYLSPSVLPSCPSDTYPRVSVMTSQGREETAGELMARLQNDPAWVKQNEEREARQQALREQHL
jgi:hypothetical protein